MDRRKNQKGIVFFTTLILLGLAVLICSAVVIMVLRDVYTVTRTQYGAQAYYLAEAGAEQAINQLYTDFSWTGETRTMGAGSYTVTIDPPTTDLRRLITSTGTIPTNGIIPATSRVIKVQVQKNTFPAFNYALFSGGLLWISTQPEAPPSESPSPYLTMTGSMHSNLTLPPYPPGQPPAGLFATIYLLAWQSPPWNGLYIDGNVSSANKVSYTPGTVSGSVTENDPAVPPLPFDNNFFNWYANNASHTYDGDKLFDGSITTQNIGEPPSYITYVNGNVVFMGNCNITGCVVATGDIRIQSPYEPWMSTYFTMTQTQPPGKDASYAALLCNGYIEVNRSAGAYYNRFFLTINGMVYSRDAIAFWYITNVSITHNGSMYTGGDFAFQQYEPPMWPIRNYYNFTYVRPHPEGLVYPSGITVLSWSEQ